MRLWIAGFVCALIAPVVRAEIRTAPGFKYEALLKGQVKEPLDLEFAPDGKLWITGRKGHLWQYDIETKELTAVWTRTPDPDTKKMRELKKVDVDYSGERGLHGIQFDPQFEKNGYVYLYNATQTEEGHFNQVTRWKLDERADGDPMLIDEKVLLSWPSEENGFHEGGAMRINPKDGKLYITAGDNLRSPETEKFYRDPKMFPRRLDDLRGKTLRINLDGTIPQDNPFVGRKDARPEIYTFGHRNPYSLAIDAETGNVYVGEVGFDLPTSAEEINRLLPGGDYGWPACQGPNMDSYNRGPCTIASAIDPFIHYFRQHTASITLGPIATPKDRLVGGMGRPKGMFYGDMVRRWVGYAYLDDKGRPQGSTSVVLDLAGGPLAFRMGPDGALYFVQYAGWFEPAPEDKIGRVSFVGGRTALTGKAKSGDIRVDGWAEGGLPLKNTLGCDVKVHLTATGTWNFSPGVTTGPKGLTQVKAAADFVLPGAAPGALVARRGDGKAVLIGEAADIDVKKGETIHLMMNDAYSGFGGFTFDDNTGSLPVKWSHGGCQ